MYHSLFRTFYSNTKAQKKYIFAGSLSFFVFIFLFITLKETQKPQDLRSSASGTNCDVSDTSMDNEELAFVKIINEHRKTLGARELTPTVILTKAANWMASDMASKMYLSHTDSLGRETKVRLSDCGFGSSGTEGENLASVGPSAQEAFNAWMNSAGHKENMENGAYSIIGIARHQGSNGVWYWANDFGNSGDQPLPTTAPNLTPTVQASLTPTVQASLTPTVTATPAETLTPTPSETITQTPQGTTPYNFSFKIEGIGQNTALGENSSPKNNPRNTTITIFDPQGQILAEKTLTAKYNATSSLFEGNVDLDSRALNPNIVKFSVSNTFLRKIDALTTNSNTTIPIIQFISGDIAKDNVHDINDYSALIACYKGIRCEANQNPDLNDDGKLDGIDVNILLRSFSIEKGD
jgi:uncharacterized protein YkwD